MEPMSTAQLITASILWSAGSAAIGVGATLLGLKRRIEVGAVLCAVGLVLALGGAWVAGVEQSILTTLMILISGAVAIWTTLRQLGVSLQERNDDDSERDSGGAGGQGDGSGGGAGSE